MCPYYVGIHFPKDTVETVSLSMPKKPEVHTETISLSLPTPKPREGTIVLL